MVEMCGPCIRLQKWLPDKDSNLEHHAPEACALPIELSGSVTMNIPFSGAKCQSGSGHPDPPPPWDDVALGMGLALLIVIKKRPDAGWRAPQA